MYATSNGPAALVLLLASGTGCAPQPAIDATYVRTSLDGGILDAETQRGVTDAQSPTAPATAGDAQPEPADNLAAHKHMAWLGSGPLLLVARDKYLGIVDTEAGKLVCRWKATRSSIVDVSLSPRKRYVIAYPEDASRATVSDTTSCRVLDLGGMKPHFGPSKGRLPGFVFSDDDTLVAAMGPGSRPAQTSTPYLWDLGTNSRRPLRSYSTTEALAVTSAPPRFEGGARFLVATIEQDPEPRAWDTRTGDPVPSAVGGYRTRAKGDASLLAWVGPSDEGFVLNADTGKVVGPLLDKRCPEWNAMHVDASRELLVQHSDKELCFWDTRTGALRRTIRLPPAMCRGNNCGNSELRTLGDWPWIALLGLDNNAAIVHLDSGAVVLRESILPPGTILLTRHSLLEIAPSDAVFDSNEDTVGGAFLLRRDLTFTSVGWLIAYSSQTLATLPDGPSAYGSTPGAPDKVAIWNRHPLRRMATFTRSADKWLVGFGPKDTTLVASDGAILAVATGKVLRTLSIADQDDRVWSVSPSQKLAVTRGGEVYDIATAKKRYSVPWADLARASP